MTGPLAGFIVTIGSGGRVTSRDSVADALLHDKKLMAEVQGTSQVEEKAGSDSGQGKDVPKAVEKPSGQLIAKEEIVEGRLGWDARTAFNSPFASMASLTSVCYESNSSFKDSAALDSGHYS